MPDETDAPLPDAPLPTAPLPSETSEAAPAGAPETVAASFEPAPAEPSEPEAAPEPSPEAALVDACYQAALGRPADPGGMSYYTRELAGGTVTTVQLLWTLILSAEGQAFRQRAGVPPAA